MGRETGQCANPADRPLSRNEKTAIDYVNWVSDVLGGHNEMIKYLASMLAMEIQDTPRREAVGELQRLPPETSIRSSA